MNATISVARSRSAARAQLVQGAAACAVALVGVAAAYFLIVFLFVAGLRIPYPFQLEWMEGAMVEQARRVLEGRPVYAEPTLEYIPFIYTPLYTYVGAVASWFSGPELLPLRLVSLASILGCFALLAAWVHRETGQRLPALLAAGMFASTYPAVAYWFDLARVDSLFLLLVLAAAYLLRFSDGRPAARILAGLLIVASFQTKQSALVVFAPMLVYEIARQRNWITPVIVLLTGSLSVLLLQWTSDGWYWFYTVTVPRGHATATTMLLGFWRRDVLGVLPIALLLAAAWLLLRRSRAAARGVEADRWFYLTLAAGMLGASWSGRLHVGGYVNVNMPAYAILALLAGLAIASVMHWSRQIRPAAGAGIRGLLALAVLLQFVSTHEPVRPVLQAIADRDAGEVVLMRIRQYPGAVLIPYHGYLAARAGKVPQAHPMASHDLLRAGVPAAADWTRQVAAAIEARRFDAVIMDSHPSVFGFEALIRDHYEPVEELFAERPHALRPIRGVRTRPSVVLERANR